MRLCFRQGRQIKRERNTKFSNHHTAKGPTEFQIDLFLQVQLQESPPQGSQLAAPCSASLLWAGLMVLASPRLQQTIAPVLGRVKTGSKEGQSDVQVITQSTCRTWSMGWHLSPRAIPWVNAHRSSSSSNPRQTWCTLLNYIQEIEQETGT